ncbi:MAG: hypothetical protein P4M11_15825 [Candidatus Pacebacteria bacterium]|nr:hypothetical protein [Candidatus Paceibacterota bacterium]
MRTKRKSHWDSVVKTTVDEKNRAMSSFLNSLKGQKAEYSDYLYDPAMIGVGNRRRSRPA